MSKLIKKIGLWMCLFVPGFLAMAQDTGEHTCVHEWSFDIQERHELRANDDFPNEDLRDIEMAFTRPYLVHSTETYCVDENFGLQLTSVRHDPLPSDDWANNVQTTIINESGTWLYDFDGQLIRHESTIQSDDSLQLNEEDMVNLGYEMPLRPLTYEEIEIMESEGAVVYNLDDGRQYIRMDDVEQIYDYGNQLVTTNYLDGAVIVEQTINYYEAVEEDKNLLLRQIHKSYQSFPNGAIMQALTTRVFYNHRLNGMTVRATTHEEQLREKNRTTRMATQDRGFVSNDRLSDYRLLIRPNPSIDQVRVMIPGMGQFLSGKLEIINTIGEVVLAYPSLATTEFHNVDLRMLPKGSYVIRAVVDEHLFTEQIIISH